LRFLRPTISAFGNCRCNSFSIPRRAAFCCSVRVSAASYCSSRHPPHNRCRWSDCCAHLSVPHLRHRPSQFDTPSRQMTKWYPIPFLGFPCRSFRAWWPVLWRSTSQLSLPTSKPESQLSFSYTNNI
jgi:hypothetical protein